MISIGIEPLTEDTLPDAISLLHRTFPVISETESPDICLPASLNPEAYKEALVKWDIPKLKYWVAVDETKKVVGIAGLYSYGKDQSDAVWLGWYGVSPEDRGKGIGRELIAFVINQANETGKRYFRLYTSTHPNETIAHGIYERRGFKKVHEEPLEGTPFKILFYQLNLSSL